MLPLTVRWKECHLGIPAISSFKGLEEEPGKIQQKTKQNPELQAILYDLLGALKRQT